MKNKEEKDMNILGKFYQQRSLLVVAFALVLILICIICFIIKFNNSNNIIDKNNIVYELEDIIEIPGIESEIRKLDLDRKQYKGTDENQVVCANCCKDITNEDIQYSTLLVQKSKGNTIDYIELVLCKDCFTPLGQFLATLSVN